MENSIMETRFNHLMVSRVTLELLHNNTLINDKQLDTLTHVIQAIYHRFEEPFTINVKGPDPRSPVVEVDGHHALLTVIQHLDQCRRESATMREIARLPLTTEQCANLELDFG